MTKEQTTPETPANSEQTADVAALQARIAELEQEAADSKNKMLRAMADFQNLKKRTENERQNLIQGASSQVLLKLLPVMDDLERAMASVTPDVEGSQWYGGFRLIPQKLRTVLESEGVSAIEAEGQEFDPAQHEAVIFDEGGNGDVNRVVAELQRGYKLRDRVLRPSMVKVSRG